VIPNSGIVCVNSEKNVYPLLAIRGLHVIPNSGIVFVNIDNYVYPVLGKHGCGKLH
jgi:hypothetical protein